MLLPRAESDFGVNSSEVADALDSLAEDHYWLGRRNSLAIERARRSLRIREGLPHLDPVTLALGHRNLGLLLASSLDNEAHLQEAWHSYEKARVLWEEEIGIQSLEMADLHTRFADLVDDWGEQGRLRARLATWMTDLTDSSTPVGKSVLRTAQIVSEQSVKRESGRLDPALLKEDLALSLALRAVALAAEVEPESAVHAECLNTLGALLYRRQLYDEALVVVDLSLEVRRRVLVPGHPQIARAYHNRGVALMSVGELEQARPDLETAYQMRSARATARFPGSVGTSTRLLGRLLFLTGDLQGALALYQEALPRLKETFGPAHYRYADGLVSLGEIYEELGEVERAENYYRQALASLDREVSAGGPNRAAILVKLGALLVAQGDNESARQLLIEAREIEESHPSTRLADHAHILGALAKLAESNREIDQALQLIRQATEVLTGYQGTHPFLFDMLLDTARLEMMGGLIDDAGRTLQRASSLLLELGDAAYGAQARHHFLTGLRMTYSGLIEEATIEATKAAQLYSKHLGPVARLLPPESALRFSIASRDALDLMLALMSEEPPDPGSLERAWQSLALSRGLVVEELEQRYRFARQEYDPELRSLQENLVSARQNLARAQISGRWLSTVRDRQLFLDFADKRLVAAEREFAEHAASLRLDESISDFNMTDILVRLPQDAALVSFVRYNGSVATAREASYVAFVATGNTPETRFVDLGSAVEIDRCVFEWRSRLLTFDDEWPALEERLREEGENLRRLVWDPVSRAAGNVTRFLFVLDGSLSLVPFAALPGRAEGEFLIDEGYEIRLLVAERDLLRPAELTTEEWSLLAIGGPDFDAGGSDSQSPTVASDEPATWVQRVRDTTSSFFAEFLRDPCLGKGNLYFLPLPEAGAEVGVVSALFRNGATLRGKPPRITTIGAGEATESAFKKLAPGHSVVHVATHGFFDLECRNEAASRGVGDVLLDTPGHQRFVSGLAFAGANRHLERQGAEDDGILTVPEIASLNLEGADWIVLSACETGIGQVAPGEGVLGLGRAFRVAGAQTLILSLWPVEDGATRDWMTELYRARFERGEATGAAVRSASMTLLARRREEARPTHPYFWAGFEALGGWD